MDNILMIEIIFLILITIIIFLLLYIYREKKTLKYFMSILTEVEGQKSNPKLLIKKNDILSQIGYKINSILYRYENKMGALNVALESNKQLMTSLSHDVRTPMTTLIGYLDAINMNLVDKEKKEEYLNLASAKAYDLKNYIDILFDWFRLNSDEKTFCIEAVDIVETTRGILKNWILILEEKRIQYKINIPEISVNVEIDINSYNRIINNVIHNILIHSEAEDITITTVTTQDKFVIKIGDNGIGISEEDLKYIFEKLYKCNKGRVGKGSGLGLNIVKILTEKMQGSVSAESRINEGTVFTIEFPRKNN